VEHVVFFPAPDGTPAFRRVSEFEEAVRFVEHLRNVENVTGASVYTLTEVPLSFRAWYRVEMPAAVGLVAVPSDDLGEVSAAAATFDEVPAGSAVPNLTSVADVLEPTPVVEEHTVPFVEFQPEQDTGSATGILVAPDSFPTSEPFDILPIAVASLSQPADADNDDFGTPVVESAPVLEPAAGARRDRGLGFFAR
jgi:hypothetical protein